MDTPTKKKGANWEVIAWVAGAFLFGIMAWGMSMYALKKNLFRTVDLLMRERERIKGLEAWVKRADELHITFDQALKEGKAVVGKPVVWDVKGKSIRWLNPDQVKPEGRAVAVIREVTVDKSTASVQLQYLGYLNP